MPLWLAIIGAIAASIAHNASPVWWAFGALRSASQPPSAGFVRSISTGAGLFGSVLGVFGWGLELLVLQHISLTVTRVVGAGGVGALVGLARWKLRERLSLTDLVMLAAIAAGTILLAVMPVPPTTKWAGVRTWLLVTSFIGGIALVPILGRAVHRSTRGPMLWLAAGCAYALSGFCTKLAADSLKMGRWPVLASVSVCVGLFGLLGAALEIDAFRRHTTSTVVVVVGAVQTCIQVAMAPLLFSESWPSPPLLRLLLAAGVAMIIVGTAVLAARRQTAPAMEGMRR